ncbi:MAG: hypothetical protein WBG86_08200, partial [Polyangiales bacterium]
ETWKALGFRPARPLRYRYSYLPSESGCGIGDDGTHMEVIFRAEGDLDGDGVMSRFERRSVPTSGGVLEPLEELHIDRRVE